MLDNVMVEALDSKLFWQNMITSLKECLKISTQEKTCEIACGWTITSSLHLNRRILQATRKNIIFYWKCLKLGYKLIRLTVLSRWRIWFLCKNKPQVIFKKVKTWGSRVNHFLLIFIFLRIWRYNDIVKSSLSLLKPLARLF